MTSQEAERIYFNTTRVKKYLLKCEGGWRWSEYKEDDERDDFDPGFKPFETPIEAIFTLHAAAGFLRLNNNDEE
jgi:hypothetical protein